jgi:hypothetical protein
MSIDRANKSVQNFGSWEEARDYAKRRIKELQYSLRIFNQNVKQGKPWPGMQLPSQSQEQQHGI